MDLEYYILALLKVAREEKAEITATKLMKILFLLQEEGGVDLGIEFEPWITGPFSLKLVETRDKLINEGKIKVKIKQKVHDPISGMVIGQIETYHLARGVKVRVPKKLREFFKKWVNKSRDEILTYVYTKYPEYCRYEKIKRQLMNA